jgi:hypothetical protein
MESGWNYIVIRGLSIPHLHYVLDHNHSGASIRPMLKYILYFHITLEKNGFWRHNPKKVVKDYCSQIKHTWEYTSATLEENNFTTELRPMMKLLLRGREDL